MGDAWAKGGRPRTSAILIKRCFFYLLSRRGWKLPRSKVFFDRRDNRPWGERKTRCGEGEKKGGQETRGPGSEGRGTRVPDIQPKSRGKSQPGRLEPRTAGAQSLNPRLPPPSTLPLLRHPGWWLGRQHLRVLVLLPACARWGSCTRAPGGAAGPPGTSCAVDVSPGQTSGRNC